MEKEEKKPKKRVRLLTMRNVYDKKISKFRFSGMWADYVSPSPRIMGYGWSTVRRRTEKPLSPSCWPTISARWPGFCT